MMGRFGFEDILARLGESPGQACLAQLGAFEDLFLKWNASINLSGAVTKKELRERHLVDAAAACKFVSAADRVTDVGSGGGLPAIPLALLRPGCEFDLYEPNRKKVAFLRTAARELHLGDRLRVHPVRVEMQSSESFTAADVSMSRAAFSPENWLLLGRSLIRKRGRVLVFASVSDPEGCAPPAEVFSYAADRYLLCFEGL